MNLKKKVMNYYYSKTQFIEFRISEDKIKDDLNEMESVEEKSSILKMLSNFLYSNIILHKFVFKYSLNT